MSDRMVIDSSVAAKWFLNDESDADLAEEILLALVSDELEVHAPRLFIYEFCNILAKACKRSLLRFLPTTMTKKQAVQAITKVFVLPIRFSEPSEAESSEALEMAVDFHKSHYDMTYVRLAENLDCLWVNDDRKVLVAVPPAFPRSRVVILSAFRRPR